MILKTIFNCLGLLAWGATVTAQAAAPLAEGREYVMGTVVDIRVYDAPDRARAQAAVAAALSEIRALDRLLAVQRPDSDVSRVNREAASAPVRVDARVLAVLQASLVASELTDGAFDVTVFPAVQAWGFFAGHPSRPPAGVRPTIAGWRTLALDPRTTTVAFRSADAGVDLGGIGKGYALDRARELLRTHGVRSAWLDLGSEIATVGLPPDGPRWRVGIRHPRRPEALLGMVEIGEGAVSTSGDEVQYVADGSQRLGHIFDPRTGDPASALVSATVIGPSATMADALSTAAVVLGAERARAVLARARLEGVFARLEPPRQITVSTTPGARFHAAPNPERNP